MSKTKFYLVSVLVVAALIVFPWVAPKFQLRMITEIVILTLFAMTWKMMLNEGGMFSFGHAVYFGLGAYAAVLGWLHIPGLSFMSGILLGALVAAAVAFLLGAFLVRMSGTYFALLTLAFNQLIWAIVWKWRDVTGGDDGLGKFPKPELLGLSMKDPMTFYYVAVVIIGVSLFLCWYFTKTPLGNVTISIKSNEERAKFVGFNVNASKLAMITLMGFFAGISGALYAQFQEFIATSVIDGVMSTNVLFMAYIGGTGFFWGPLIGSGIFVYLSEYLSSFTDRWEFILGMIFIFVVLFAPRGILGTIRKSQA
ncbi:MAG TPA: branched-chain amino acid ABC transporter permease [Thermodesulfobacteriota bacterium]|nr:branched-chain amino acid ABC transporter permease [Thermodesulfobacteriota bacterium]